VYLEASWLSRISQLFELRSNDPRNRELSTVYGLSIPEGLEITAVDLDKDDTEVELDTRVMSFEELEQLYRDSPESIADGLHRVLRYAAEAAGLRSAVLHFLE
jgi:hypothetical protein